MAGRNLHGAMADVEDLVLEDHFAMVPEWILDAALSDCAVRLYAVLLRYGQSSGARMPARSTLAGRLHKRSTDTVDRAMRELVAAGAVQVEPRFAGRERLTNLYRVRTTRPVSMPEADPRVDASSGRRNPDARADGSGRTNAATRTDAAGRASATGTSRIPATTRAANLRLNPKAFTQRTTPPPPSQPPSGIAAECGIDDWQGFVHDCISRRLNAGQPAGRWAGPCLEAALQLAVHGRAWPAQSARLALLEVAGDPRSRSPMRLAEAGPWWDGLVSAVRPDLSDTAVAEAEAELAEADGLRVVLQARARAQLEAERLPVSRASVTLRARDLLHASPSNTGTDHG